MATLTINPTYSVDGDAVITGTTDAVDGARVTLDIRPDGGSTITDLYTGGVAGGVFSIPTNEAAFSMSPTVVTPSSQALDDNNYIYDPNIWKLQAANTWLHLYWKGGEHVDNDGAIYGKISSDDMLTWGAEFLIVDDASGFDTET